MKIHLVNHPWIKRAINAQDWGFQTHQSDVISDLAWKILRTLPSWSDTAHVSSSSNDQGTGTLPHKGSVKRISHIWVILGEGAHTWLRERALSRTLLTRASRCSWVAKSMQRCRTQQPCLWVAISRVFSWAASYTNWLSSGPSLWRQRWMTWLPFKSLIRSTTPGRNDSITSCTCKLQSVIPWAAKNTFVKTSASEFWRMKHACATKVFVSVTADMLLKPALWPWHEISILPWCGRAQGSWEKGQVLWMDLEAEGCTIPVLGKRGSRWAFAQPVCHEYWGPPWPMPAAWKPFSTPKPNACMSQHVQLTINFTRSDHGRLNYRDNGVLKREFVLKRGILDLEERLEQVMKTGLSIAGAREELGSGHLYWESCE